ncbi:MAG TPA: flagellar hook-basal body complex protein [Clostridia bacterium]|nr:flagellar hook-basal body complex protein [Clostridia bacterium]
MMRSMFSAVSGLKNHQVKMDVIGNNIANVNTVAYKSGRVTFQDIFNQTLKPASGADVNLGGINPQQVGLGVSIGTIDTMFTSAGAQRTDYALDLSIEGDGFFVVQNGAGETFYTRAGNFRLDDQGNLVNANGMFVLDVDGNAINLGGVQYHDISIDYMGRMMGIPSGSSTSQVIAVLGIATFTNTSGLQKAGNNTYIETTSSGSPLPGSTSVYKQAGFDGAGALNPGTLEMSNVDLSNEFTDMIITQRGYQANARVITVADSLLEELVNLKR